jgi:hypothetical protein
MVLFAYLSIERTLFVGKCKNKTKAVSVIAKRQPVKKTFNLNNMHHKF